MALNLVYGKQQESNFLDAGEAIAEDVAQGKFFEISKKLNNAFFDGGVFTPKSFASLASINIPKNPTHRSYELELDIDDHYHCYITIGKKTSFSAVMGFVEGIPVIGSAIAALKTIYHLFGMLSSYTTLKKAVKELNDTERSDYNIGRGASCHYTKKVFEAAIDYTVHQNHLIGSLMSLIPFVKPITRIAQGVIFNAQANNGVPSQV